ncbi:citrate synthase/methylcitrate synthase [Tenuibacillus multivorans]|uniref:Citrate synthase n=1 Tax=Tenuibacillus multivorans TaxID=237069 RepID=A0A1G9WFH7_9BACI|nr:citrate synthase/methylcitrate synthase [Tenuibacillus multivorans]GEL76443.1 citrate synthase 1 [Tenuibacillus multivorans]SDM83304.1 citrate synthase [Tenuibacillus multivorans]
MIHKGLKGIVCTETKISMIDGEQGQLVYRGYDAKALAKDCSFEEVAYLLWYGELPTERQLDHIKGQFKSSRQLPNYMKHIIEQLPESLDMLDVLRSVISTVELSSFDEPRVKDAIKITTLVPGIIAYRLHIVSGKLFPEIRDDLDHVAYYYYMVTGQEPKLEHVRALETYMILTMEHGLNASTFSARVTVSTKSDLASAITSAIGTMKGPLHGGAPTGVLELLNEAVQTHDIRSMIQEKVQQGEKLMGFGHRVYKTMDPRAIALKDVLQQNKQDDDWFDLALIVEEIAISVLEELKPGRGLYTNVEYYAAAVMNELEIDANLFTATFTASRVVGWSAHVMEQLSDNVIFRPKAEYVGPVFNH